MATSKLGLLSVVCTVSAVFGACGSSADEGQHQIYVAPAGGEKALRVASEDAIQELTWSTDSQWFAFVGHDTREGAGYVVIVDPTDIDNKTVVQFDGSPDRLIWSPDGERLAVSYHTDDHSVLGVVSRDGSGLKRLVERQGAGLIPSVVWLDDARLLVADSVRFQTRLIAYDAASGESVKFGADTSGFPGTALSPDGTMLAGHYYCERGETTKGVWVFEITTGESHQIDRACGVTDLAWSPEGSEIAYTAEFTANRAEPADSGGLYVVSLSSGDVRRITNPDPGQAATYGWGEPVDVGVEWLPNGAGFRVLRDHYYNCSDCGDARELVLVGPDGSEETPIAEGEIQATSTDAIAHTNDDGLLVSSIDGGDGRLLFRSNDEWRFRLAEFSPDGQWIAFTRFHCGECEFP